MKLTKSSLTHLIKEELDNKFKVTCHCLCLDCVFNKNKYCVADKIELDFAKTDDGRTICECKTYEVK